MAPKKAEISTCILVCIGIEYSYETRKQKGRAGSTANTSSPYAGEHTSHTAENYCAKTYFTSFPGVLQGGNYRLVCVASSGVGISPCAAFVVSAGKPKGAGSVPPPRAVLLRKRTRRVTT